MDETNVAGMEKFKEQNLYNFAVHRNLFSSVCMTILTFVHIVYRTVTVQFTQCIIPTHNPTIYPAQCSVIATAEES